MTDDGTLYFAGNGDNTIYRDTGFPPANSAPTANAQSPSTSEDQALPITLTGADADGNALTFAVVTNPANGTLTGAAPNLTYTPNANFNGNDSFTFTADDGQATSAAATVSITVNAINDPPTANAQSPTTGEDQALGITLTGSDVEGSSLTFAVVTNPASGTLTGTAPNLTYTPNADFNGNDSFTFTVNDGQTTSAAATISITVNAINDLPIADAQNAATDEDAALGIILTGADVDGDALTFAAVTNPANGTLTGTAPNLTYTPNANYNGNDSFTFTANDGTANSTPATVAITVNAVNDPPVATDDIASTLEDTPVIVDVRANDSDSDSAPLTVSQLLNPSQGSAAINGDNTVTFIPAADFSGTGGFDYVLSDGQGGVDTATVSITVNPVNDPPTANAIATSTDDLTPIDITLDAVDAEGDPLTYTIVAQPASGTLTLDLPQVTYEPALGFVGDDTFTYKASDDSNAESNTATITVSVNSANAKIMSVFAGGGYQTDPPGANTLATDLSMGIVMDVATDSQGNTYIAHQSGGQIYKVDPAGFISIFATSTGDFNSLYINDADDIYASEGRGDVVRKYTAPGYAMSIIAGEHLQAAYAGDGGPATAARFFHAPAVSIYNSDIYVGDESSRIRVFTEGGNINTYLSIADGVQSPEDIFITDAGIMYVADRVARQIMRKDLNNNSPLEVIAGTGVPGFSGDGGPALDATFAQPHGVWVDALGRVYVADRLNHRIRMIDGNGIITTVVGGGAQVHGAATALNEPLDLHIDANGHMFIAQPGAVLKVTGFEVDNLPPVLASPGDQTVSEGATLALAVSATDPDNAAAGVDIVAMPAFGAFANNGDGTGTLTLTPGFEDAGAYTVTLKAIDAADPNVFTTMSFTVTVANVNRPPAFAALPGTTTLQEGATLDIAVAATDPDGTALTLSATNLPAFASFTDHGDNTATLHLAPGFADAGTYNGIGIAADDGTDTDNHTLTVIVNDTPPDVALAQIDGFAGGKMPVALSLDKADDLAAATFNISYDPNQVSLDANDVRAAALAAGFTLNIDIDAVNGKAGIGIASGSPLPPGSGGDLLELSFQVASTGVNINDVLALDLTASELLIADGQGGHTGVIPSLTDGQITVVVGTIGDLNDNAALDLEDVVLVLQLLAGLDPGLAPLQQALADYNQDGTTDIADAYQMLGDLAPAKLARGFIRGDAVTIDLTPVQARGGDALAFPLRLQAADPLHAVDLVLRYNPGALALDEVYLLDDGLLVVNTRTPGRIHLVGVSQNGLGSLDGVLAELSFTAKSAGVHALYLDKAHLLDAQAHALPVLFAGQLLSGQALPETFAVEPGYPNPFNPETTLRYALARGGEVEIVVYDILGQPVETLLHGRQRAGQHEVIWRAEGYAPGVYLAVFRAQGQSQVVKMTLIK